MSLIDRIIHLAVLQFCLWQTNRYIRKADRANRKVELCIQEAKAWLNCMNQHRAELEGGDAP